MSSATAEVIDLPVGANLDIEAVLKVVHRHGIAGANDAYMIVADRVAYLADDIIAWLEIEIFVELSGAAIKDGFFRGGNGLDASRWSFACRRYRRGLILRFGCRGRACARCLRFRSLARGKGQGQQGRYGSCIFDRNISGRLCSYQPAGRRVVPSYYLIRSF